MSEKNKEVLKEMMKDLIIQGVIVSARYGSNKFDDTNKYRIAIKGDNIPYDDIHAFDSVGSKLTPSWYKNRDGYINLNSIYNIPIKDTKGKVIDFEEWQDNYNVLGALVVVKIKQKEGAIYPLAIKVIEDGEDRDPFADM